MGLRGWYADTVSSQFRFLPILFNISRAIGLLFLRYLYFGQVEAAMISFIDRANLDFNRTLTVGTFMSNTLQGRFDRKIKMRMKTKAVSG